jgi:hypothetical protein
MMRWVLIVAPAALLTAAYSDYVQAKGKFDRIAKQELSPGARILLTPKELNAYADHEVKRVVPDGIREPEVKLGPGLATGTALVDFAKVRAAQGNPPGWFMSRLLSGEHPVSVTARIQSAGGKARVDVQRVEVSGIPVEGRVLDWMIENYLRPRYPEAKIGQPFELGHRMERVEVQPSGVNVHIAR